MNTVDIKAIHNELSFWVDFVKSERFAKRWESAVPNKELHKASKDFICEIQPKTILDVGSGVCSLLYGLLPESEITCVDPLGDLYGLIYDYSGKPFKQPLAIMGEEMTFDGEFDLVHCSNALDHCQNPITVLANMITATKPGGWTMVQGFVDEGFAEGYSGFHKWDMKLTSDGLLKIAEGVYTAPGNYFKQYQIEDGWKHWFIWALRKEKVCQES